jgi:hypothetical protein
MCLSQAVCSQQLQPLASFAHPLSCTHDTVPVLPCLARLPVSLSTHVCADASCAHVPVCIVSRSCCFSVLPCLPSINLTCDTRVVSFVPSCAAGGGLLVVLECDTLAHHGSFRPAVCCCGPIPLQAQLTGPHAGLLLAVQCSAHLILILPQHTVQCVKGGWHSHAVHLRAVNDTRVRVRGVVLSGWMLMLVQPRLLLHSWTNSSGSTTCRLICRNLATEALVSPRCIGVVCTPCM